MTIDDVMKLTPEQVQRRVAELVGWTNLQCADDTDILLGDPPEGSYTTCVPDWHIDLNDAMTLVPQNTWRSGEFEACTYQLIPQGERVYPTSSWWMFVCPNKPLALCRAYILWKEGAK